MKHVALFGYPLEHSISPAMHNAAFQVLGLDWDYRAVLTSPEGLGPAVQALRGPSWAGANVTVPYKRRILSLLDEVDPEVQGLGAVNTILNQGGLLMGHNTDLDGFIHDLRSHGIEPSAHPALVLGAGGGARAVLFALSEHTSELTAICRRVPQGEQVAEAMEAHTGVRLQVFPWTPDSFRNAVERASLIVNATPVGMHPHTHACPWPMEVELPPEAVLYDLVYNPPVTTLVARARSAGLSATTGLGMLVEQGALALELWTGLTAPRAAMMRAAEADLEGGYA